MTAVELLQRAHDLGLQLEPRTGGWLAVRPASKLPPDLAAALRRHKTEVISLLSLMVPARKGWQSVPPGDLPLVPLKPHPTPVQQKMVIAYLTRQCGDQQLRAWLTRRKSIYVRTTLNPWDSGILAYAAARDAACWQLNCTESEVWSLLDGIESCVENLMSWSCFYSRS